MLSFDVKRLTLIFREQPRMILGEISYAQRELGFSFVNHNERREGFS
jgi:hypothetical protein